ncbi:MAG: sulfur reduction protein DsrE, partial [Nocardioidaceae bacterium]|nr:sulfur reduction protein DsrE [Nocardioidaceae bacterium]
MTRPLVVKVTAGQDDAERCNQGFTVAAAAVAAGSQVSLWLSGEAAWFGVPGRAEAFRLDLATPLADLL